MILFFFFKQIPHPTVFLASHGMFGRSHLDLNLSGVKFFIPHHFLSCVKLLPQPGNGRIAGIFVRNKQLQCFSTVLWEWHFYGAQEVNFGIIFSPCCSQEHEIGPINGVRGSWFLAALSSSGRKSSGLSLSSSAFPKGFFKESPMVSIRSRSCRSQTPNLGALWHPCVCHRFQTDTAEREGLGDGKHSEFRDLGRESGFLYGKRRRGQGERI